MDTTPTCINERDTSLILYRERPNPLESIKFENINCINEMDISLILYRERPNHYN